MPIAVVCPSCAAKMRAPDSAAGRKTKCPKCGTALVVPRPGAEHAQSPHQQPLPRSVSGSEPTPVRFDRRRNPHRLCWAKTSALKPERMNRPQILVVNRFAHRFPALSRRFNT